VTLPQVLSNPEFALAVEFARLGGVTRHKLVKEHLRSQQQAISIVVFSAIGKSLTEQEFLTDRLDHAASRRAAS
jgi:hypothetical protein